MGRQGCNLHYPCWWDVKRRSYLASDTGRIPLGNPVCHDEEGTLWFFTWVRVRRINQIGSVEAGGKVEKKEKERRFLFYLLCKWQSEAQGGKRGKWGLYTGSGCDTSATVWMRRLCSMPVIFVRQAQARPCHWLTGHQRLHHQLSKAYKTRAQSFYSSSLQKISCWSLLQTSALFQVY